MQAQAGILTRVRRFVFEDLWQKDFGSHSITGTAIGLLQFCVMVGQGFVRDQLLLRASALTYMTVLSLIPLLLVMFAVVGLVGDQQALIKLVVNQLTAASPGARDLILERLNEVHITSLGTIGASLLMATTVLALRHLETTMNEIWGLRQSRSWMRRFADYLTVMVVAPILTAVAISLATTLQSEPLVERLLESPRFAMLYKVGLAQLPHLLLVVAFTFLYWFFPNTNVRALSALLGGLVATLLFSAARYLYVDLSIGSARYSMLFGGMVALPLILAWLYVCWAIVLMGAEVAFAHQNLSHYRREARGLAQGPAERETVGLRLALEIARAYCAGAPPLQADTLADRLSVSVRGVRELLDSFEQAGLVVVCSGEQIKDGYVPARPVEDISVAALLAAMRGPRVPAEQHPGTPLSRPADVSDAPHAPAQTRLLRVLDELDRATASVADELSLADILEEERRA